jgi:hypothetical protein
VNSTDALTLHPGYWCECWTQSPATGGRPAIVAGFPFRSRCSIDRGGCQFGRVATVG